MRLRMRNGRTTGSKRRPMTTERRSLVLGASTRRRVLLLLSALAIAGCGAFGGPARPDLADVLRIDAGGVAGGVELDGEIVVLARYGNREDGFRAKLLSLAIESGEVRSEHELPVGNTSSGLVEMQGDLVFRAASPVEGLPAEAREWPFSLKFRDPEWLVVLDGDTFDPKEQYSLPSFDDPEPLVVMEGKYWALGNGNGWGYIDLENGQERLVPQQIGGVTDVRRLGDQLLVVRTGSIRLYDLSSGQIDVDHFFTGVPGNEIDPLDRPVTHRFHYYEGDFWMPSLESGELDRMYRYDLKKREMTDPRPAHELPSYSFETAAHRWELFRDDNGRRLLVPGPDPEDGDVWKQVDKQTDEVIEEFDFGDYRPRFGTEGYLWLTKDIGGGQELARLDLS